MTVQVLVEDALKLQNAVLSASISLAPALQQLIPNLMAILQRGKDNAAIFQVLEGFLVTADADLARAILQGHLAQIAPVVERSLGAVLTAAQAAQSGTPQPLCISVQNTQRGACIYVVAGWALLLNVLASVWPICSELTKCSWVRHMTATSLM